LQAPHTCKPAPLQKLHILLLLLLLLLLLGALLLLVLGLGLMLSLLLTVRTVYSLRCMGVHIYNKNTIRATTILSG
jgi:cell division septal protein FtsQ